MTSNHHAPYDLGYTRATLSLIHIQMCIRDRPEGVEMVMPGDNVELTVELIAPIAIENGTKFSIREGGRTVGAGNVSEVIE